MPHPVGAPAWAQREHLTAPLAEASRAFEDGVIVRQGDGYRGVDPMGLDGGGVRGGSGSPAGAGGDGYSFAHPGGRAPPHAAGGGYQPPVLSADGAGRLSPRAPEYENAPSAYHSSPGGGAAGRSGSGRFTRLRSPREHLPHSYLADRERMVGVVMENGGMVEAPCGADTIGRDVKEHIERVEAVDASRQRLWLHEADEEVDDFTLLKDAGVTPGCLLRMTVEATTTRPKEGVSVVVMAGDGTLPGEATHVPPAKTITITRPSRIGEGLRLSVSDKFYVTAVDPDGPAGQAGVVAGMRILKLNGAPLKTKKEFVHGCSQALRIDLEVQMPVSRLGPQLASVRQQQQQQQLLTSTGSIGSPAAASAAPEGGAAPTSPLEASQGAGADGAGPPHLATEADVRAAQRAEQQRLRQLEIDEERTLSWFVFRILLVFITALSIVVGIALLAIQVDYGDELDCGRIEDWTITAGVLMLVFGICQAFAICFVHANLGAALLDPHERQGAGLIASAGFLFLLLAVLSISGLTVLTRDMTRAEREVCSTYRDIVIAMVVLTALFLAVIVITWCSRATFFDDTRRNEKEYRKILAERMGMPSINPQDYWFDRDAKQGTVPIQRTWTPDR